MVTSVFATKFSSTLRPTYIENLDDKEIFQ